MMDSDHRTVGFLAKDPTMTYAAPAPDTTSIQLLGCFGIANGGVVAHLPLQAQRVVAYLAISMARVARPDLAGRLWPHTGQSRSQANLRTALWRINKTAPRVVDAQRESIALGEEVDVDYQLLLGTESGDYPDEIDLIGRLRHDLLSGWDEEWLIVERERTRQLRLRRLEQLSRCAVKRGDIDAALRAGYAAIQVEPLREPAHLVLIEAHIAEGNTAEAVRQLRYATELLTRELGIAPSHHFCDRVCELGIDPKCLVRT